MTILTRRRTRRELLAIVTSILMSDASAGGKSEHSVLLENEGATEIFRVQLLYGSFRFPDQREEKLAALAASQYNDRLEVPEEATLAWETGSQERHQVTVAIRRHLPDAANFNGRIEFQVNESTVQVFVARRTPRYTFVRQQIF